MPTTLPIRTRKVFVMFPVVVIRQPGQTPIHLQIREAIELGRECTGVLLVDPRVSRRHLVLAPTHSGGPAEVAVLDLGSMNGTLLDGHRIATEVVLHPGQEVRLGETTIRLVVDDVPAVTAPPADEAVLSTTVLPAHGDSTNEGGDPSLWAQPAAQPVDDTDADRDPWL